MDSIGVQVAVLLAILVLVERLVAARRHDGHSRLAVTLTWLVLTGVALWCGGLVAFAAVHVLLFTLGRDAATIGLVLSIVVLATIPFALALVVRRGTRDVSARG